MGIPNRIIKTLFQEEKENQKIGWRRLDQAKAKEQVWRGFGGSCVIPLRSTLAADRIRRVPMPVVVARFMWQGRQIPPAS